VLQKGKDPLVTILEYLTSVLALIDFLKELGAEFLDQDVRRTFFTKLASAVRVYYLGLDSILIASKLKAEGNYPAQEIPHLENFGWVIRKEPNTGFLAVYQSILKLNLLNGSWICFESCLDEIYKAVVPGDVREKAELRKYHAVIKILGDMKLDEERARRLRKKLRDKYVSISDKWNPLFGETYSRARDVKQDRVFLEFFASCRNCMHNNSISFKDARFDTKFGSFDFQTGEVICFITPDLLVKMIRELAEIYMAICRSIDHKETIVDPYVVQTEHCSAQ
jgi:hypothetical protein